jgi:hypothetical protein
MMEEDQREQNEQPFNCAFFMGVIAGVLIVTIVSFLSGE